MENLADRRKMEIACKIPLKSEICCNSVIKFEEKQRKSASKKQKSEESRENGTNPRLKSDGNDAMMMIFYEIEHKSVIKCEKDDEIEHKSAVNHCK